VKRWSGQGEHLEAWESQPGGMEVGGRRLFFVHTCVWLVWLVWRPFAHTCARPSTTMPPAQWEIESLSLPTLMPKCVRSTTLTTGQESRTFVSSRSHSPKVAPLSKQTSQAPSGIVVALSLSSGAWDIAFGFL